MLVWFGLVIFMALLSGPTSGAELAASGRARALGRRLRGLPASHHASHFGGTFRWSHINTTVTKIQPEV